MNSPIKPDIRETINSNPNTSQDRTLLIIEDDDFILEVLSKQLKNYFQTVITSTTPENGLLIIEQLTKNAVILSDIENQYSPLNGLDVAIKSFNTRINKCIPIFLMSGRIDHYRPKLNQLKRDQIINDYIKKPFDYKNIAKILQEA